MFWRFDDYAKPCMIHSVTMSKRLLRLLGSYLMDCVRTFLSKHGQRMAVVASFLVANPNHSCRISSDGKHSLLE